MKKVIKVPHHNKKIPVTLNQKKLGYFEVRSFLMKKIILNVNNIEIKFLSIYFLNSNAILNL